MSIVCTDHALHKSKNVLESIFFLHLFFLDRVLKRIQHLRLMGGSYPRRVTRIRKKKNTYTCNVICLTKNSLLIVTGAERVSTPHRTHFAQVVTVCITYILFLPLLPIPW